MIGWQLRWVVDFKDWIEYNVLDFDAGEGWTLVDDTATFSDGSSTDEVFSMLDGTTWMDGRITLSKNRKGIICDKEAIRRTQQITSDAHASRNMTMIIGSKRKGQLVIGNRKHLSSLTW